MDEFTMVRRLAKYFSDQGFLTRQEVGAGYGRADLVLVKLNKNKCKIRQKRKQVSPLLKEHFFQILRQLPDIKDKKNIQPMSFNDLSSSVSMSKSYLKYHLLRELELAGYIKKIDNEYFYKINGWVPLVQEMVAIEAKLKDWKRGFIQANRYKSFADKSYLAILAKHSHLIDTKLLITHNIGLFLVSDDGKQAEEVITPTLKNIAKPDKRNFVSELYLQDVLRVGNFNVA